jgi:type II secretory ATPase GspE/PulE/Tfp pilus assembly ATPase PilB-like protein
MNISAEKLKELLVRPGHIGEADFDMAVVDAEKASIPLEQVLVDRGMVTDEHLGQVIAECFHLRFVDLKKEKIDEEILHLIPELVARSKGVIAFARGESGVKVGMINPDDIEVKHFIEKRVGQNVSIYFITKRDLQHALSLYKASIKDAFDQAMNQLKDVSLSREQRDEATIRVVDMIIQYGYDNKSSDIHIEPYRKKIVIRFRIDGVMHDVLDIPKQLTDTILTRIKILARMRTDEHRAAQDGKFRYSAENEEIDVRVSIVPVTGGENVVMRLLAAKSRQFDLTSLGLSDRDRERVNSAIKKPHGMILVTGPTGSGKTTTVYAVMKILNKREVHISTIEDPVEYDIEGISQIQVNTKTNLTFAKGLRAIVRQDPDIIMVGEIRDAETADIAVNSAMTGHLVLSTLHANDAATTLPRLLDMGVEPFLVASTVNVAIAQRLVRMICEKCRVSYTGTDEEKKMIERDSRLKAYFDAKGHTNLSKTQLYKGAGCKTCGGTGYAGRIGVFEVLEMGESIKDLIMKRASSDQIMVQARKNGMTTMLEDGITKVLNGITTLQEVLRIINE